MTSAPRSGAAAPTTGAQMTGATALMMESKTPKAPTMRTSLLRTGFEVGAEAVAEVVEGDGDLTPPVEEEENRGK